MRSCKKQIFLSWKEIGTNRKTMIERLSFFLHVYHSYRLWWIGHVFDVWATPFLVWLLMEWYWSRVMFILPYPGGPYGRCWSASISVILLTQVFNCSLYWGSLSTTLGNKTLVKDNFPIPGYRSYCLKLLLLYTSHCYSYLVLLHCPSSILL